MMITRRMKTLTAWSRTSLMGERLEETVTSSIPSMMSFNMGLSWLLLIRTMNKMEKRLNSKLYFLVFDLLFYLPALNSNKQLRQSWELLCSHIPNFRTQMVSLSDQIRMRKQVCRKVSGFTQSITFYKLFPSFLDHGRHERCPCWGCCKFERQNP